MLGDKKKSLLISYTAVFVALIAAASWISIPVPPVPFTLQTMMVLLCAGVMKRYAVIPVTLYITLGCLNLPIFHNGTAGLGVVLGPTGGYMFGFIIAAVVAGYLYESKASMIHLLGLILGTISILLFGTAWIAISSGMTTEAALIVGCVPFLVGDGMKLILAFYIARMVEKINPIRWD
ncbi:MAG: biotin transporter BioY [Methanomicrobiales archaeon]|jgi:biotin transport system substrate-specific component|nr:biotin transporter BioY [Methanomicrobiales archaeon]